MSTLLDIEWLLLPATLAKLMIATAVITFITLLIGPTAPYGRYSTSGWGFMINGKVAWFTQEIWSFLIPSAWLLLYATPSQLHRVSIPANAILMGTFLLHYFNRDLIFPFRIRAGKPTPFIVWLLAAVFCVYNGYMQTRYLLEEAPLDTTAHLHPKFLIGLSLWAIGWGINLHSDTILISLRKPTEKKGVYKIPRGGMFEYVSTANYFGEILEWFGWAVASGSLPAAAFTVFTFANLAPRGWKHHLWYKRQFKSYPKSRRAVLPFIW